MAEVLLGPRDHAQAMQHLRELPRLRPNAHMRFNTVIVPARCAASALGNATLADAERA